MSDKDTGNLPVDGPHQHAHSAPTTQQLRTVGQRRRDAEEKLEHHLEEARHKSEHPDDAEPKAETGDTPAGNPEAPAEGRPGTTGS